MKRYVLLLPVMFGVVAGCHAASPSFSSFYTNHFTTNNLVIKANLNPTQFDTNSSSITITITNVSGIAGGSLWTNISGVIQPRSGQTTNALSFTSASSDNATNTVLTIDTVDTWTDQNTKLLQLRHVGTNVAYVTPYGSFESGKGVSWASPSRDDLFLGVHDFSLGESDYALIYGAAIDGSSPTNYAEFSAQMNSGASPAGTLNLAALTNGVSSYFQVTVQPDQSVARIELQSQGQRTFYVEDQTGYSGAGTKMLGDDGKYHDGLVLWTNISNVLQPLVGFDVLVTNLTSVDSLVANGSFHLNGVVSSNLIANTNNLNPFQVGTFQLVGPSTTASDTRITLSTGIGYQFLVIQNSDTNSAFNMRNGEPQWDDPTSVIHLSGGDWNTTNKGDGMLLYHNGLFWSEIGRFFANTNTSTPVVMNPTDNYLPRRQTAGVFNDSPLATPNGSTNLVASGGIILGGTNSVDYFGGFSEGFAWGLFNDTDKGGSGVWNAIIGGGSGSGNQSYVDIGGTTASSQVSATLFNGSDNYYSSFNVQFPVAQSGVYVGWETTNLVSLRPFITDGADPYAHTFDTANPLSSSGLATFMNGKTNMVSILTTNGVGAVRYGPGDTNVVYKDGLNLIYEGAPVAGNPVSVGVRRGASTAYFGVNTAGGAFVQSTSNRAILDVGGTQAFWDGTNFQPADANKNLGTATSPWLSLYVAAGGGSGVFIRAGSGDPTGVVTANVGSLWLRTDGGAGSTLYVKESATDATGWVAK